MRLSYFAFAALFLSLALRADAETAWPQFRGPDGQGHSSDVGVPLNWSETENIVWKTPIEGRGWSSPVFADGKIWLTTATPTYVSEEERAAKVAGNPVADAMEVAKTATLSAVEIDQQSGKVLRYIPLLEVDSPQPVHSLNSFASPTPVLANGRLYCHFGAFGTVCLDTTSGSILWQKRFAIDHSVGPGSSPILVDDLLVLTCDGTDAQYIVALNADTGETVWKTDRPPMRTEKGDFKKAFSTPLLVDVAGQEQLVIPGAQWFVAYDPASGDELWRIDHGRGFSNVPSPVSDGARLFLCTGFVRGELWAVRPEGQGDVTETHVDWKQTKQIPTMPSPVIVDGRIYIVSDGGVATSFDGDSGEEIWRERLGGNYSASPLYADGKIYFCNHEGRTTVLAPGDEFRVLAENDLDGQLMSSPAVIDGDLLLRTDIHLYLIAK